MRARLISAGLRTAISGTVAVAREAALHGFPALAVSLGGIESLIEHPASMTHASVADSTLAVDPGLIRLSVGIEHGDDLIADVQHREIVTDIAETEGVIDSSLFVAGKQAGLSDAMVMKLANIFGWDIDFVLDIRKGDHFMLVYEKLYREGEYLREGEILAATFINQGERFQAIRFDTTGGSSHLGIIRVRVILHDAVY